MPAIGHPPLLRHHGHDDRRHQPRSGGARLRHAGAGHRGWPPFPRRPTDPLREQLRHDRTAPRPGPPPRAAVRRSLRPQRGDPRSRSARPRPWTWPAAPPWTRATRSSLHEPSYVSYRPCIVFAGGVPVGVNTTIEEDFALDPAKVEAAITPRTKAMLLNYPCNPTGAVLPHEVQDEIARIAVRHDLLVYTRRDLRPARLRRLRDADDVVAAGHAKADRPDGRLLQGVRHDGLADRLHLRAVGDPRRHPESPPVRDHVRADGGPGRRPRSAQVGRVGRAVDAQPLRSPPRSSWSKASTRSACERSSRRAPSTSSRRSLRRGSTSEQFAEQLLRKESVAVVPGSAFGEAGEGHVRCCYATSEAELKEALVRIDRFVKTLRSDS